MILKTDDHADGVEVGHIRALAEVDLAGRRICEGDCFDLISAVNDGEAGGVIIKIPGFGCAKITRADLTQNFATGKERVADLWRQRKQIRDAAYMMANFLREHQILDLSGSAIEFANNLIALLSERLSLEGYQQNRAFSFAELGYKDAGTDVLTISALLASGCQPSQIKAVDGLSMGIVIQDSGVSMNIVRSAKTEPAMLAE